MASPSRGRLGTNAKLALKPTTSMKGLLDITMKQPSSFVESKQMLWLTVDL